MPICKHNKHVAHGPVFHIYTNFFGHSGSFYFMENEAWQSIQIQFLQAVMCRITWPQLWNLLFLKHRIEEVSWKTEQGRTTACVCVRVFVWTCAVQSTALSLQSIWKGKTMQTWFCQGRLGVKTGLQSVLEHDSLWLIILFFMFNDQGFNVVKKDFQWNLVAGKLDHLIWLCGDLNIW